MTTFYALLLCGIIIVQAAASIMRSRQVLKMTKKAHQLYERIRLLEKEVSGNG